MPPDTRNNNRAMVQAKQISPSLLLAARDVNSFYKLDLLYVVSPTHTAVQFQNIPSRY